MSQITPKNKEAGRTKPQESSPNASKQNNKTDPNEESKDSSQNQEKKKGIG